MRSSPSICDSRVSTFSKTGGSTGFGAAFFGVALGLVGVLAEAFVVCLAFPLAFFPSSSFFVCTLSFFSFFAFFALPATASEAALCFFVGVLSAALPPPGVAFFTAADAFPVLFRALGLAALTGGASDRSESLSTGKVDESFLPLPFAAEPFCMTSVVGIVDLCFGVRSLMVVCLSFDGEGLAVLLLADLGGVGRLSLVVVWLRSAGNGLN